MLALGKTNASDEVQLSPRVPKAFRDQINREAAAAGCSVGVLIMRMHASHDPTARRLIERNLGRLGSALNDAKLPVEVMRDVRAAMAELRSSVGAMMP